MRGNLVSRTMTRGSVQQAAGGNAALAQVALTARPITNMGMASTRAVFGQRQVLDLGYYISELRNRITATSKEADALNAQTLELQKRDAQATRLQESVQAIKQEVDDLQGELHDITYAQTRIKEGASLENLRTEATEAESSASRLRNEANVAYKARVEAEERLQKNEAAAIKLRAEMEARIEQDLGLQAADRYRTLNAENAVLKQQEVELRKKLQEAAAVAAAAYSSTTILSNYGGADGANASTIQKAITLHRQIRAARRELDTYKAKVNSANTSDPEVALRNQLKNQFRVEQAEARAIAEEVKITEANLVQRRKLLAEILPDSTTAISKEQRDLLRSVLKAEAFIQEWPSKRSGLQMGMKQLQTEIVGLLARLPPPKAAVVGAEDSPASLEAQLQQRTRELDRLTDADVRLTADMRAVNDQVAVLRESLERIRADLADASNIDDVEEQESSLRARLAALKESRSEAEARLKTATDALRAIEAQIQTHEEVQHLRTLFERLGKALQTKYSTEAFTRQKTAESNYSQSKSECLELLKDINAVLLSQ